MIDCLPQLLPDLDDFASSWFWLSGHPHFFYAPADNLPPRMARHVENEEGFTEALDIYVYAGDGASVVALEVGPWVKSDDNTGPARYRGEPCHEYELDVVEDTFEHAVCALARKVLAKYGSYPEYRVCSHCLATRPAGPTDPDREWFCSESCEQCGPADIVTVPSEDHPGLRRMVPWNEVFDCEHFPKADLVEPSKDDRAAMTNKLVTILSIPEQAAAAVTSALVDDGWERVGR